jgi:DNA-binding HxlR family transcriptional regulator
MSSRVFLYPMYSPMGTIKGIRRGDLLPDLGMLSPGRLSRQLRRLRELGVIKRVSGSYRYYLTNTNRPK